MSKNEGSRYVQLLLTEGAKTPCDENASYEMYLPDWVDHKKIKKGQLFFVKNLFAMTINIWIGLLICTAENTILRILMSTGKSNDPKAAYKRYFLNLLHNQLWMRYELKPGSKAWESLKYVRKIHLNKTRTSNKAGIGIISQKNMALIQLSSLGCDMTKSFSNGLYGTDEEFECYNHTLRTVGHLLGIKEEFNICGETAAITKERIAAIKSEIFKKSLKNLPDNYETYSKGVLDGIFCFYPFLNYEILMFLIKRWIKFPNYYYFESERISKDESNKKTLNQITWYNRIRLFAIIFVLEYCNRIKVLRFAISFFTMVFLATLRTIPILAIWKFGYDYAFVKI